jgi:threonine dehydratase
MGGALPMPALTMEMVHEAAAFLKERVLHTPLEESPALGKILGRPVFLKLESLQRSGSFKIRGAYFRLAKLTPAERAAGVATCSAGNHGKAVAYVAAEMGLPITIYVPRNVDEAKYRGMLALGAHVVRSHTDSYDDTEDLARAEVARNGQLFISAYDDEYIMAANGGTLALEVQKDLPAARSFIVPVGGGGLFGGFSYVVRTLCKDAVLVGCQHVLSPGLPLSLERGEAVTRLPGIVTAAGGLEGGLGRRPFEVLKTRVSHVALLTEDEILSGVRFMLEHHQYLVEPSAAVTIAACLYDKTGPLEGPAVVVLSGRNMALSRIKETLVPCSASPQSVR